MKLQDRVFLVTGGASGLGAATVELLVAAGSRVVVCDLNRESGEALCQRLGEAAAFAQADVTSPDQIQAAVDMALTSHGGLHGAVHCAGILHAARIISRDTIHDLESFRRVVEVNLVGTFNVLRLVAAGIAAEHHGRPAAGAERGVIVMTASVAAFEGQVGQAAYSASKGGVAGLTLPAARDLAGLGIRVVSIAPGIFETPMMNVAPEPVRQSLLKQAVLPTRFGQPAEFAAFVRQIIENPMLNGSVHRLDGAVRMTAR